MKKTLLVVLAHLVFINLAYPQTNQQKAQQLATNYINKLKTKADQNITFNPLQILRSSYNDTRQFKNFNYKIDSLKLEGKKIDARIPKMKTTAEINQAKKDSKNLSDQLVSVSDQMIDFMTEYKGTAIGWKLKAVYRVKNAKGTFRIVKKIFYLNQELTKIDSLSS